MEALWEQLPGKDRANIALQPKQVKEALGFCFDILIHQDCVHSNNLVTTMNCSDNNKM